MIGSINKMDCTGCKMCRDICPVGAISYQTDNEGFWYPKVNDEKCIKCGKCVKACPSLSDRKNTVADEPEVYAAWALDDSIRLRSTSGGIFYILAKHMIQRGGLIAACKYSDDFKSAYHDVGNSTEDLEAFKGSKYFQSNTEGIYRRIKKKLAEGNKVLFCGAPCQVAGLNNYAGVDNDNLLTVDFICRGINSPMVFKKYVEDCEKRYNSRVINVHLKNKNKGWARLGTYMEFRNGKKYYRDKITDPWVNGYIKGNLFMRPCCSECKYKERIRVADISVGDFWGFPGTSGDMFKGISVILVNTDKGRRYLEQIKEELHIELRDYDEALKGNKCLLTPASMGERRGEFFDKIYKEDFEKVVWELLGESKQHIFVRELKYNIKSLLGR